MKRKFMTAGIILIIILSITCSYSVFNDFFPKASQIICPNIESVFSATVTYNSTNKQLRGDKNINIGSATIFKVPALMPSGRSVVSRMTSTGLPREGASS